VILGITGSIAAYKSPLIARELIKGGAKVVAAVTTAGRHFIGDAAIETVTGCSIAADLFPSQAPADTRHVDLTGSADLLLVAPATANIIGKFARGIADDMLSTMHLAFRGPVVIAPAMNSRMLSHPAVRENISILEERGAVFVAPGEGELACGDSGTGRLAELTEIIAAVEKTLAPEGFLHGKKVLVSAGGTEEPIDLVRVLTNRSSGKMGLAMARTAVDRGAEVCVVHGRLTAPIPGGIRAVNAPTHTAMAEALEHEMKTADILVMAAAVSDYSVTPAEGKIKRGKDPLVLELLPTTDILQALCHPSNKGDKLVIAFSAETAEPGMVKPDDKAPLASYELRALEKMRKKRADFIVCNTIGPAGAVFGSDKNAVTVIAADGSFLRIPEAPKSIVAEAIWNALEERSGTENE